MRRRKLGLICLAVMLLCASCGSRHPQEPKEAAKELQELNEAETNVSTQEDSAEKEQEQVKEAAEQFGAGCCSVWRCGTVTFEGRRDGGYIVRRCGSRSKGLFG